MHTKYPSCTRNAYLAHEIPILHTISKWGFVSELQKSSAKCSVGDFVYYVIVCKKPEKSTLQGLFHWGGVQKRRTPIVSKSESLYGAVSGTPVGTAPVPTPARGTKKASTGRFFALRPVPFESHIFSCNKQSTPRWVLCLLVPEVGLEPTRCRQQRILSPSRLPIPSFRR